MDMPNSKNLVHQSENAHECNDSCHLTKMSLKHAQNMKKSETNSYRRRCMFFLGISAAITFFFCIVFFTTPTLITYFIEMVISIMGITVSHAWYRTTLNNNYWHKSWQRHVNQLENQLAQCKKSAIRVISGLKPSSSLNDSLVLNQTLNAIFFGFWCLLPVISLFKFFYYFVYVNGVSLSLMNTLFLCIPFLIMVFLSIALNVFMCMFSSKDDAEIDNKELDISLQYKNHHQ
ncbi:RipA family octameric membrane protein [Budvicia aquatica]|uniref:RipA family octameric membrane protein n=1 Tax=Budvicia aquatica TaxID=82979 RepID=UPI004039BD9B